MLAFLASCSADDRDAEASGQSPSPTAKTATAAQYASLIAERKASVQEVHASLSRCLPGDSELACVLPVTTAGVNADTVALVLAGAQKDTPNNKTFIGQPPEEIRKLVGDTSEAATAVKTTSDAYTNAGCPTAGAATCDPLYFQVQTAVEALAGQIDAWAPWA